MSHKGIDEIEKIRNDLFYFLSDKTNADIANRIINETLHKINYRLAFCLNQIKYLKKQYMYIRCGYIKEFIPTPSIWIKYILFKNRHKMDLNNEVYKEIYKEKYKFDIWHYIIKTTR